MNDAFDDLFEERMKTIDTRLRLNKLIALNLQFFNAIQTYARQNNIPLPYSPQIIQLIRKIEEDISTSKQEISYNHIRRKVTEDESDEDVTEPFSRTYSFSKTTSDDIR
ncbi:MAG: hypothetical protein QG670_1341 [Thermoproteota archaeon]|nr:hypothetical protein [Thermoproteota archaeon]